MKRRLSARLTIGTWMIILVATVIAGCGPGQDQPSSSGPLHSLAQNSQLIIDGGAIPVLPGEVADFAALVSNSGPNTVALISAKVIPLPGFHTPRLAHLTVIPGLSIIGSGRGWPDGIIPGPFVGATIKVGRTNILYAISGDKIGGDYGAAGLRITYKVGGVRYTTIAWSMGLACVRAVDKPSATCEQADRRAMSAVRKLAG